MKPLQKLNVSEFTCGHFKDREGNVIPDGSLCCFNHAIGLPTRGVDTDGKKIRHPIYDYQIIILNALLATKLLWILKAPKLGITELFLRWILFKALTDPAWESGQVMVTAGMNQTTAARFIERMKELCNNPYHPIELPKGGRGNKSDEKFNTRNEFYINSLNIRAYPANNIDAIRSQPDPKLILVDEAAFFRMKDTERVKDAAEHYIGNTDPWTIFVSTAGEAPTGVMYEIGEDPKSKYTKIWLTDPDKYGLPPHPESGTSIYDKKTIDSLRSEPSFRRNYLGEWGSGSGNVFDYDVIERMTEKYVVPSPRTHPSVLAVDPGFGSSRFAMLGAVYKGGVIYTSFERQFDRTNYPRAFAEIAKTMSFGYKKLLVDGANAGVIQTLRDIYRLQPVPMSFIERGTGVKRQTSTRDPPQNLTMLEKVQRLMDRDKIRIHASHRHLLEDLRAIRYDDKGALDKKGVSFDMGDCFRMACDYFHSYDHSGIVIRK